MSTDKQALIDGEYRKLYGDIFSAILDERNDGFYDEAALPSYTHSNGLMSWLFWNRVSTVFELLPSLPEGAAVLDFGCGGGISFKAFHALGVDVVGCDIEHASLAQLISKKLGQDNWVVTRLNELDGEKFDCIIALDVLEHIENLGEYIDALKSVSNPGATWLLSGPTENVFYKVGRILAGFSGHYHCRNIYQIENEFQNHGLERETVKTLYWPVPLFRVSRWRYP